jgi:hypothetical protein
MKDYEGEIQLLIERIKDLETKREKLEQENTKLNTKIVDITSWYYGECFWNDSKSLDQLRDILEL